MTPPTITPLELARFRREHPGLVLLDVRLAEDFAEEHLAGALHNCVFEVQFLDRMRSLVPDQATPICCYGFGNGSLESQVAVEKLRRVGYAAVFDLGPGLTGCRDGGIEIIRAAPQPAPEVRDGEYVVDRVESWVEWTGRNLLKFHRGRVALRRGGISIRQGRISGGEFVLSMADITCDDLAGTPLHDVLIAHLRSDDFFDTDRHPDARFVISRAIAPADATPGSANLAIVGDLTLNGVTAPLELSASAGLTPEGRLAAQAGIELDRCRWNVLYGSGKFFHRLAGHLVNDLVEIRVRIVLHALDRTQAS